ncbi:MAG TPA: serine hydrolase [Longimicrobium sp.]|nr:serine hydrolase [Longimicrobium sp.]
MTRPIRRITRALLLALAVVTHASAAQAQARDPLQGLDAYIEQAMRDWQVPGLSIAIVRNDSVIFAKGYGVREIGKPARVDENTVFAVASNTKALTATAVGMLVSEGKAAWTDRATKHVPTLQLADPWATRELNLRDLLAHRSGHQTWAGDLLWYATPRTRAQVLAGVREVDPQWGFRQQYGYSNLMFIAAGEVVPAVTGQSWETFVAERFFAPLGMTRTSTTIRALPAMENVATPHTKRDGAVVVTPYRNVDAGAAAAGINSSARDWAQWIRLQLGNGAYGGRQLVDSAVVRETRTPQTLLRMGAGARRLYPTTHFSAYGLGWFLRDYHGRLLVEHSGGMDGMLSQTGYLPEERFGVVIFTNYDEHSLGTALFYDVVDRMLGLTERRDWSRAFLDLNNAGGPPADPEAGRAKDTRPSVALERYAGTYTNDILGEARVTVENGRLYVRVPASTGISGPMEHWHYDTFRARWEDAYLGTSLVTFALDAEGRPTTFRTQVRPDFVDPLEYVFTRVPDRR